MRAIKLGLTLLFILTLVRTDIYLSTYLGDFNSFTTTTAAIPLSDLITVGNYYGCKTWVNNKCTECSKGFYFSSKGVCCQVPLLCSQFNLAQGVCLSCYQGYNVVNNTCKLAASSSGCVNWNGNTCIKCSQRFYLSNGVCNQVSDQCYTWDSLNGKCLSCYNGYILINGVCSVNTYLANPSNNDPLCVIWAYGACSACASRAYLNFFGVCTPVSDQCQTWDPKTGACLNCFGGYVYANGACNPLVFQGSIDPACAIWNANITVCLQCSQRYYFNGNKCLQVSDQCNTWNNTTGRCNSCYDGYDLLLDGTCQASVRNTAPSDKGCGTWDWKNQKCLQCSNNWVFNNNGLCGPVSDQCNTYDLKGACASCYKGYLLFAGKCVLSPAQPVLDNGCGLWDWSNQKCLQCSNNWVFNSNGVCIPVSDQCSTFDLKGNCFTCYVGYNLVNGTCVLAPNVQSSSSFDLGCSTWDWKNQKCLKCSNRWVFNTNGFCVPVSDQCNTFDSRGNCITCYNGYNLVSGNCVLPAFQNVADPGCADWDGANQICRQCGFRWMMNGQRKCVPVFDNCQKWDNLGVCTSCYSGYILQGSNCVVANSLCQTSNSNGACITCYTGYVLDNGNCVPISKLANLALYYSLCCPQRLATLTNSVEGSPNSNVPFRP